MQVRIRHHERLRHSAPCSSLPGSGLEPRRGLGVAERPDREHDLPLPDLRDQPRRHEQRLRRNVQNAATNPPTVETEAASSITQTAATLNATVNPNGGEVSECKFEYGTTTSYGPTRRAPPAGSGRSPSPCPRRLRPDREHDLPLQDLRDQRRRHEQRLDETSKRCAEPPRRS